jgi:hypothetical protein
MENRQGVRRPSQNCAKDFVTLKTLAYYCLVARRWASKAIRGDSLNRLYLLDFQITFDCAHAARAPIRIGYRN